MPVKIDQSEPDRIIPKAAVEVPTAGLGSRDKHTLWAAVAIWVLPMLVIAVMVIAQPNTRTVTHIYHEAVKHWWAGTRLYGRLTAFHYLPHFAPLFTPFHALPRPWGDVLWRLGAAALLATGLWRAVRLQFGSEAPRVFLWASVLAVPLSLPALRNGQANALFSALTLHAVACLPRQQWWTATVLAVLAVAVKPIGVVLVLLAPFVYPALRWRLALAALVLAVFPFVLRSPEYVLAQHGEFLENLRACVAVTGHHFADMNGILRTFGTELPSRPSIVVRVLAGAATLALWWLGSRRLREPAQAMWLYALTASYLMLFNPMNEENSYVILAPALAFWAMCLLATVTARPLGWAVVFMALSMGLLPNVLRPLFGNYFALFWHPVMTLLFISLLARYPWRQGSSAAPTGRCI